MDAHKLKWTMLESEIFAFLAKRAGEKFSQREIAKELGVSPTAIANSLQKLMAMNLTKFEKTKTINFISFNRDEKIAIELKRAENLKNIYLSGVLDYLETNLAGGTIILFGSYSLGEDTNTSDIDLAVIERKDKILKLEPFEEAFFRKINVNFYDSWNKIHKELKNNILNGIVLQGSINL